MVAAIMAKAPRAGQVKTRLCPPLEPPDAEALYRCFVLDKIAAVGALRGVRPAIAYTPGDARGEFERLAPGFLLVAQEGPDLGARLQTMLARLLAAGHLGAIALDTDTPTLPQAYIHEAVDCLAGVGPDLVVGPAEDGGYYLIGVRAAHPEVFADMPWSTPELLEVTLQRADALGLRVARLPTWYDVDTATDLARLRVSLPADRTLARHTRRLLEH